MDGDDVGTMDYSASTAPEPEHQQHQQPTETETQPDEPAEPPKKRVKRVLRTKEELEEMKRRKAEQDAWLFDKATAVIQATEELKAQSGQDANYRQPLTAGRRYRNVRVISKPVAAVLIMAKKKDEVKKKQAVVLVTKRAATRSRDMVVDDAPPPPPAPATRPTTRSTGYNLRSRGGPAYGVAGPSNFVVHPTGRVGITIEDYQQPDEEDKEEAKPVVKMDVDEEEEEPYVGKGKGRSKGKGKGKGRGGPSKRK